jgi:hypothetical protein
MATLALDAMLDAQLVDVRGMPTTLRAHLGPQATAIVFVRHYG